MHPKSAATTLLAALLVCACAGRPANPVVVQQYGDDSKTCEGLARDMAFIETEVQRLTPQTKKGVKNVALGVTGVFLVVPWFFMDLSQAEQIEIDAYRQRYNFLLILAEQKNCDVTGKPIPPFMKMPATTQAQAPDGTPVPAKPIEAVAATPPPTAPAPDPAHSGSEPAVPAAPESTSMSESKAPAPAEPATSTP